MQYLHPIQRFSSTRTTPSSVLKVAPTGQTWTQGGLAHWLQSFGTKKLLRISFSGTVSAPVSLAMFWTITVPSFLITYFSTQVRKKNGSWGTSFSILQASTHLPHPMHLSISIPIQETGFAV